VAAPALFPAKPGSTVIAAANGNERTIVLIVDPMVSNFVSIAFTTIFTSRLGKPTAG
jgi:hypothetical protein